MKIAYLILAHKNEQQLLLLMEMLLEGNNHLFIHIDAASDETFSRVRAWGKTDDHIHILEDSFAVKWGAFSFTLAIISLLNACQCSEIKFDFISTLSGQDLPLKSNEEIALFLSKNKTAQFVEYNSLPYNSWNGNGGLDRVNYFWLIDELGFNDAFRFVEQQKKESIVRIAPSTLTSHGGSCWFTITSDLLQYICEFLEEHWEAIYSYFRYTFISDEILLQSIILNSPFREEVINNNLRYVDWSSGPEFPKILTVDDCESLKKTKNHFARKFDTEVDSEVIEYIKNTFSNHTLT
ncbi:beta-1,6-N-acetylglucosaminyltransferase [Sphingobacterium sp.]|uniref:beta-1,6-N-acetylglucosaminyltransferase n=1 Tax=Sphingobacterium sp. TaxID=341027 RepID=UPI0028A26ED5|nr:beta-1,6-N-acetylglucosaminyltransferase [Sphingobacterium sp.]